jgi:putative two-component system response regulator
MGAAEEALPMTSLLRERPLAIVGTSVGVLLALYAAGLVLISDPAAQRFQANVLYNAVPLVALLASTFAISRSTGRERLGWVCLAACIVLWSGGDWMYALYWYGAGETPPTPGFVDVLYYVGAVALVASVPLLAFSENRLRDARWLLDAAMLMTVAGVIAWDQVLQPTIDSGGIGTFGAAVALGYPLLDIGLIGGLIVTLCAGGGVSSRRATVLLLAVAAQVASDGVYSHLVATSTYDPSANYIDLGWLATYGLFAIAFVLPPERDIATVRSRNSLLVALPYIAVVPLTVLALDIAGEPSRVVEIGAIAVWAMIVLRQVMVQRENQVLARTFEYESRSRQALLEAQSDLGEAILSVDEDGVLHPNEAAEQISGYTIEELQTLPAVMMLVVEDERVALREWLAARFKREPSASQHEVTIVRKDGAHVRIELSATSYRLSGKWRLLIMARDVTAKRQAEDELRASEEKLRAVFAAMPDTVAQLDRHGRYLYFKPAGAVAADVPVSEVLTVHDLMQPELAENALATIRKTLETRQQQSFEFSSPGEDGARYYEGHIMPAGEDEVVTVVRDVTEQRQSVDALRSAVDELARSKGELEEQSALLEMALAAEREQSRRDSLTGALNHGAISEELRRLADGAMSQFAVVMVDVDGMKAINDTFGHRAGDMVLLEVARALQRDGALVGRYGGDEFVVVLPHAAREAANRYHDVTVERLKNASITDPSTGDLVPVRVSVGVATFPEEASTVAGLIQLSDASMYAAKRDRNVGEGYAGMRSLGDDRAARMVGELVPLLTSPGNISEKMRLVSHKLSIGAGYDVVNFVMARNDDSVMANIFGRAPRENLEDLVRYQEAPDTDRNVARLLNRSRRPILIDLDSDELLVPELRERSLELGFHSALIAPMVWQGTLVGALTVANKARHAFGPQDIAFVSTVSTQVTVIVKMGQLIDDLQDATQRLAESQAETVMMLAAAAEAHDRTTGQHLMSIRALAEALAREMGYDDARVKELGLAAVLHDIGKFSVPDSVLSTPGSLDDADWELMKRHTIWGGDFLAGRPGFELAAQVARCHHERWDGRGYPTGLAGGEIPEAAAIVTVADSFDAMTHDRPYKEGRGVDAAMTEIRACSGTQFSPHVVAALEHLYARDAIPQVRDGGHTHEEEPEAEAA